MAKRHDDALAVQAGACNPIAIALAIASACREIAAEPGHIGTDQIKRDPAVQLMVHQLAFLCAVTDAMPDFEALMKQCQTAADRAAPTSTA